MSDQEQVPDTPVQSGEGVQLGPLGQAQGQTNEPAAEVVEPDQPVASMKMTKEELVAQAEAADPPINTEGKTKADLVQELGGEA